MTASYTTTRDTTPRPGALRYHAVNQTWSTTMPDPCLEPVASWLYHYALKRDWLADRPSWAKLSDSMRSEWRDDATELLRLVDGDVIVLPPPPEQSS